MKIAAAQIKLEKGITPVGLERHIYFIEKAIEIGAKVILFPELSLSGYEPSLAMDHLLYPDDDRLLPFKTLSREGGITILLGAPTFIEQKPQISAFMISPNGLVQTYSKQYLHSSETGYFQAGTVPNIFNLDGLKASIAICYESKVEEHIANAKVQNPAIRLVSVVEDNIDKTIDVLTGYAVKYSLPMIISNCIGSTGGYECNGGSCYINNNGQVLGQLDSIHQGLLIVDTHTEEVEAIYLL